MFGFRDFDFLVFDCFWFHQEKNDVGGILKKDNIFQTLLVGALGGAVENLSGNIVLSGILIGGNAIINKSNVPQTMFKYAALSAVAQGVKSIGEAKAADNYEDDNLKIR